MRLRRAAILLIFAIGALSFACAADVPSFGEARVNPKSWVCTTTPGEHWTQPAGRAKTDAWEWVKLGTPAPYPSEIEPMAQHRWPFIWTGEDVPVGKAVYFRRQIWLDAPEVAHATLKICSYGAFVVYVNGERVLEADEAGVLHGIDISENLEQGKNWIAIAVVRGEGNYGLLVMGEAELTWPVEKSRWQVSTKLGESELRMARLWGRDTEAPTYGLEWTYPNPARSDFGAWRRTEPGLSVDWEGVAYATLQPVGGMAEYSTAYFRNCSIIPGIAASGTLTILGDDSYRVYVNGQMVALEKRADHAYIPIVVDITDYLLTNNINVIAAKVTNDWGPGRIHIQPTVMVQF